LVLPRTIAPAARRRATSGRDAQRRRHPRRGELFLERDRDAVQRAAQAVLALRAVGRIGLAARLVVALHDHRVEHGVHGLDPRDVGLDRFARREATVRDGARELRRGELRRVGDRRARFDHPAQSSAPGKGSC
jgi:hypothetical protein